MKVLEALQNDQPLLGNNALFNFIQTDVCVAIFKLQENHIQCLVRATAHGNFGGNINIPQCFGSDGHKGKQSDQREVGLF